MTKTQEASVTFGLEYDGPALEEHEMDVRDLAPALLSTSNLFQELNRIAHPLDPPLSVNVRATAQGSFLVELRILYELAKLGLNTPDAMAGANLGALLLIAGGVIDWYKKRRLSGEPVSQASLPDQPGTVRLTYADGTTLDVPEAVLQAVAMPLVQQNVEDMVRPLQREGVERLSILQETVVLATVESEDAPAFAPSPDSSGREVLRVSEREVYLSVLTAGFESGRWRFSDGTNKFTAALRDEAFIQRVQGGEGVSPADVLLCLIRETQYRDDKGLHSTVEVLEVLQHLPPAQGQLNLEGSTE